MVKMEKLVYGSIKSTPKGPGSTNMITFGQPKLKLVRNKSKPRQSSGSVPRTVN